MTRSSRTSKDRLDFPAPGAGGEVAVEAVHRSDRWARACRTYRAYLALGHEVAEGPHGRVVREPSAPRIYDANHLQAVNAETEAAIDAVLAFAEKELGAMPHRHVLVEPATPPAVAARLALLGYRPVESGADWAALRGAEATKGRPGRSPVTQGPGFFPSGGRTRGRAGDETR